MGAFVALLRAVNVGGNGKLPMNELKAMCEALGFAAVRTYIVSGNVVFQCRKSEATIKAALETQLEAYAGKPVGVLVRSAEEMARVASDNPFRRPNRTTRSPFFSTARRRPMRSPACAANRMKRSGSDAVRSTSIIRRAWEDRSSPLPRPRRAPHAT